MTLARLIHKRIGENGVDLDFDDYTYIIFVAHDGRQIQLSWNNAHDALDVMETSGRALTIHPTVTNRVLIASKRYNTKGANHEQ